MNKIITFAIGWLITRYTDDALQRADVDRIKRFVNDMENTAIAKAIKHQRTADLIRGITHGLSDNVIDWVIKTILHLIRVTR